MRDDVEKSPAERRRARLRFRSARRGFKEVDLIFGAFASEHLDLLADSELDAYERLLDVPDQEIYAWLRGHADVPTEFDTAVFAKLKALCAQKRPTWNV
jgi:antitoxin CptB